MRVRWARLPAGVLIAGKSGSGKSTSTLACLTSGLLYAGDDYVLVDIAGAAVRAQSLFDRQAGAGQLRPLPATKTAGFQFRQTGRAEGSDLFARTLSGERGSRFSTPGHPAAASHRDSEYAGGEGGNDGRVPGDCPNHAPAPDHGPRRKRPARSARFAVRFLCTGSRPGPSWNRFHRSSESFWGVARDDEPGQPGQCNHSGLQCRVFSSRMR